MHELGPFAQQSHRRIQELEWNLARTVNLAADLGLGVGAEDETVRLLSLTEDCVLIIGCHRIKGENVQVVSRGFDLQ